MSSPELKGYRDEEGSHVVGNGFCDAFERSLKLRNHSPTGPEWGYPGSGPSQLALAMLLWAGVEEETALRAYHYFKDEVVGKFHREVSADNNCWVMNKQAILSWLEKAD